jgi:hypothetical protein
VPLHPDQEAMLKARTKVVYAVGFARSSSFEAVAAWIWPRATRRAAESPADCCTGRWIAVPHVARDPSGNREHPVGMFKFMRHLKNAVPIWRADGEDKYSWQQQQL